MADATKVQLGPCTLMFYHPSLGSLDLGHTIGGTTATYSPDYHETSVDLYGSSVVEQFLVGETWMIEANLAEWTLPNLRASFGVGDTLQGDDSISIGSKAGKRSSAEAGLLVAHPVDQGTSRDYDFGIYRAVHVGEIKVEFKSDGERVIPITVKGLIDENRSDGNMLGFIGDSIA